MKKGNVAIQIGVSQQTVDTLSRAILDVIHSQACDKAKAEAVKALGAMGRVDNTTVTNCTFGYRGVEAARKSR